MSGYDATRRLHEWPETKHIPVIALTAAAMLGDRKRLAELLAESQCAACKTSHHLQRGPGNTFLCVGCAERASSSHWFDEGGSGFATRGVRTGASAGSARSTVMTHAMHVLGHGRGVPDELTEHLTPWIADEAQRSSSSRGGEDSNLERPHGAVPVCSRTGISSVLVDTLR